MMAQRRRQWPSIKTALGESLVIFAPSTEDVDTQQTRGDHPMPLIYWPSVYNAGLAFNQHWVKVS